MDKEDRARFSKLLDSCIEAKGRKPMSAEAKEIWFRIFSNVPFREFSQAMGTYMRESSEWPEPSVVYRIWKTRPKEKMVPALPWHSSLTKQEKAEYFAVIKKKLRLIASGGNIKRTITNKENGKWTDEHETAFNHHMEELRRK